MLGKKNFPSKILLEYTIIRNSKALAIPFEIFEGTLTFPKSGHEKGEPVRIISVFAVFKIFNFL